MLTSANNLAIRFTFYFYKGLGTLIILSISMRHLITAYLMASVPALFDNSSLYNLISTPHSKGGRSRKSSSLESSEGNGTIEV
jgi:hypothetical protein